MSEMINIHDLKKIKSIAVKEGVNVITIYDRI